MGRFTGYQQMLSLMALRTLTAGGVSIPDIPLAIGVSEDLQPIPLAYQFAHTVPAVQKPILSIDDVAVNGQGNPIHPTDFGRSGYLGDAIGQMEGV